MELMGDSQSTFTDMVSELGLAAALGPQTEYTLLAPLNTAFTSELTKQILFSTKVSLSYIEVQIWPSRIW